ncbi:hypothetical protein [Thioclava sp. F36-7]|uniref:hypothetical protein n=1 Tax=Thioclava sp. F36-7 TaxID=1915317 RepID=UPI00117F7700|nr:hypothetical protein [Thioclava sp. F36-7]
MNTLIEHFADDLAGTLKATLRFAHFIGLAIGLGGMILLDLMLLKFLIPRSITEDSAQIFASAAQVVCLGLKILWLSGFGFLMHYAIYDPDKLANPKLYAKLAIVVILTINGWFIHTIILPVLRGQIGKTLLSGIGHGLTTAFIVSGAISVASWYSPAILGVFWQFNGDVSPMTILFCYLVFIILAAVAILVGICWVQKDGARRLPNASAPRARVSAPVSSSNDNRKAT